MIRLSGIILSLAIAALSLAVQAGPPRPFDQSPPQPPKHLGSSITLTPGMGVSVSYEVENGELINFVTIPAGSPVPENMLTLQLTREGGVTTHLGPTTPIVDVLTIRCLPKRQLDARCFYNTVNAPNKVDRVHIADREGAVKRKFRWGLNEVRVAEFKVGRPIPPPSEKAASQLPSKP